MGKRGRQPIPNEIVRRRGQPGHSRSLADTGMVLAQVPHNTEPPRQLGRPGREVWDRALSHTYWLAESDLEMLLVICEAHDERAILRANVLASGDTGSARRALRALDDQILRGFREMGWSPAARTTLALGEVSIRRGAAGLDDFAALRDAAEKDIVLIDE